MAQGKTRSLVFKNYVAKNFVDLLDIPLVGQTARARNRFIAILEKVSVPFEEARMKLIEEYAEKDTAGKPLLMPNNNYKLAKPEEFETQWQLLRNTEVTVDILSEQMGDYNLMKNIVLNLETPFNVEQTATYDLICEQLEKVS